MPTSVVLTEAQQTEEMEMGKKLILMAAVMLLAAQAQAETVRLSQVVPNLSFKQGAAFSLIDNQFNYLSTVEVAKYKGFSIDLGYAGRAEETKDKAVVALSYNVLNLQNLGVELPLAKYIDLKLGVYAGMGNINFKEMTDAELDWGVQATVLSISF